MSGTPSPSCMSIVIENAESKRNSFLEADAKLQDGLTDQENVETWRRAAFDVVPEWDPPRVITLTKRLHETSSIVAELHMQRFEAWAHYITATADKVKALYGINAIAKPTINGKGLHVVFRD